MWTGIYNLEHSNNLIAFLKYPHKQQREINMRLLIILASLPILASFTALGIECPNLIKNSSFELGMSGFECLSFIYPGKGDFNRRVVPAMDKSTKVHGEASLKIDNLNGDHFKLICDDVKLIPGKEYTVSLWIKSNKDNYPVLLKVQSVAEDAEGKDKWVGGVVGWSITKKWTRYYHKFTVPASGIHSHYNFSICTNPTKPGTPGIVWLDAFQINMGKLKEYSPLANTEGSIALDRPFTFYAPGEEIKGQIKVVQYSGDSSDVVFSYDLINNYYKNKIFSENIKLKTRPGLPVNQAFSFKENKRGAYALKARITGPNKQSLPILPAYFVVSESGESKTPTGTDEFSIGINMNPYSVHLLGLPATEPMLIRMSGFSDFYKYYAMQGVRWLNGYTNRSVFSWIDIEPKQGQFNWALADKHVEDALKRNIRILPMLGGVGFNHLSKVKTWHWKEYPAWVIKRGTIKPALHSYFAKRGHQLFLPRMEDWANFIKAVVGRYKGKITHYEILGEPNLYAPPKEYVKYLKVAYEVAKSVDPKCKIVGVCTTGDLGGDTVGFLEKCCKLGVLNYLDIVSFHPYNSRLSGTAISAQSAIADLKKLIALHGKKKIQLWNTEVYFLGDSNNNVKANYFKGNEIARRYFIDLGEGLKQSMPLNYLQLSQPTVQRNRFFYDRATSLTPSSHSVIYATIARLFPGAKPTAKIKWPDKNICYVFKKNKQFIAVAWNYDKSCFGTLKSRDLFSNVKIFDMFGNLIENSENITSLKLQNEPFYFFYNGKSREKFLNILKNANIESSIKLIGAKIEKLDSVSILTLELKSQQSTAIEGKIKITSIPEGISIRTENIAYGPIQPRKKAFIRIPVELKNRKTAIGKIKLHVSTKNQIFNLETDINWPLFLTCKKSKENPIIDGCLSSEEWAHAETAEVDKASYIKSGSHASWNGPLDCSAKAKSLYDMKNIYFSFEILDDISGRRHKEKPWIDDTLELFFHTSSETGKQYTNNTYRFFLSPSSGGNAQPMLQYGQAATQITWHSIRDKKGYVIEIAIPLASLGLDASKLPGTSIDFDFAINDADLKDEENQLVWSGNRNENYKDRSHFGRLYFVPPLQEKGNINQL